MSQHCCGSRQMVPRCINQRSEHFGATQLLSYLTMDTPVIILKVDVINFKAVLFHFSSQFVFLFPYILPTVLVDWRLSYLGCLTLYVHILSSFFNNQINHICIFFINYKMYISNVFILPTLPHVPSHKIFSMYIRFIFFDSLVFHYISINFRNRDQELCPRIYEHLLIDFFSFFV